jgi:hypothetical protein
MILSLAVIGCGDDGQGGGGNTVNINAEPFGLTQQNAAALAGQVFTFPATLFGGLAGQTATLTFGPAGTTFTLVIGDGAPINGTITYNSCTLTQDEEQGEFEETFDPCNCVVDAQDIPIGDCTDGQIQLTLGLVDSETVETSICVANNGDVTIGDNTTPIGKVDTGATGGTGD